MGRGGGLGTVGDRREHSAERGAIIFALFVLASPLLAQQAGIATIAQPQVFGSEVFDSAGKLYAMGNGPVTAGAVQTQNGGGTCLFSNGFFEFPGPCTDTYVGKIDASGKLIFGTYLVAQPTI